MTATKDPSVLDLAATAQRLRTIALDHEERRDGSESLNQISDAAWRAADEASADLWRAKCHSPFDVSLKIVSLLNSDAHVAEHCGKELRVLVHDLMSLGTAESRAPSGEATKRPWRSAIYAGFLAGGATSGWLYWGENVSRFVETIARFIQSLS